MKGEKRWKQFEGQQGVYSSEFGDKAEVGWNSGATTLLELVFLGIQKKHRQLELDASCCSVQVAKI